jgi:hypothetical protein
MDLIGGLGINSPRREYRLWTPTAEQQDFLRAVEPTSRFLDDLPEAVLQQFAGQWVAARNAEVIAARPTRAELDEALGSLDDPYTLKLRLEKGVSIRRRSRS